MANKKKQSGMTDVEFNALVDEGFKPVRKKKRTPDSYGAWVPPESLLRELEREGQQDGLTGSAARFSGALKRIFGTTGKPISPAAVETTKAFDARCREFAKANGIELRDD